MNKKSILFASLIICIFFTIGNITAYFEKGECLEEKDKKTRLYSLGDMHYGKAENYIKEQDFPTNQEKYFLSQIKNNNEYQQIDDTLNEVKKRNGLILIEETELNFKGKNYKKEQQTKNENLKLPYLTAKILDKEFQKTVLQKLEGPTRLIAGGALVQKIPIKNFDWRYDIKDYAETHEGIGKNCQVITKLFEKTKQKAFSYKDGKIASLFYANVIKSTEEDVFFMFIQNIVKKYKGIKNVDLSIDTYKSIGQKVENYFNENNFIINLYTEITTSIPADWINVNLLHKIIKYKKLYKDIFICAGSDHIKKIRPTLIDLGFKSIKKCSNKISQFEINTTKKISYSNPILVTKAYFPVYDLKKEFFDAIPPRKTNLSIKYIQKTKDSFIGNKRKRDDDDETLPPNKRQKFLN